MYVATTMYQVEFTFLLYWNRFKNQLFLFSVMEFHDGTYNDSFSSHTRPNDLSDSSEFVSKTRKKDRAETLWDLELEKENEDQLKEAEQLLNTNNDEDSGRRRRQSSELNIPNNQNLLAQITSTGVLLKPLDAAQSTLDFVFVNKF